MRDTGSKPCTANAGEMGDMVCYACSTVVLHAGRAEHVTKPYRRIARYYYQIKVQPLLAYFRECLVVAQRYPQVGQCVRQVSGSQIDDCMSAMHP